MPDEVAQIIAHCEECLIKAKIITSPFSATEIQGGILKEYLIDEDYLAPQKVNFTNHRHFFMLFLVDKILGVTTTQVTCYLLPFLYLQREERLEARHLALQKAVK